MRIVHRMRESCMKVRLVGEAGVRGAPTVPTPDVDYCVSVSHEVLVIFTRNECQPQNIERQACKRGEHNGTLNAKRVRDICLFKTINIDKLSV